MTSIDAWICSGNAARRSTPKGLFVRARTPRISLRMRSGGKPTRPSVPKPPASETAAHTSAKATPPMPARKTGCSMPKRSQIGVRSDMMGLLPPEYSDPLRRRRAAPGRTRWIATSCSRVRRSRRRTRCASIPCTGARCRSRRRCRSSAGRRRGPRCLRAGLASGSGGALRPGRAGPVGRVRTTPVGRMIRQQDACVSEEGAAANDIPTFQEVPVWRGRYAPRHLRAPTPERFLLRDAREIGIGREELQFMANAELGEDRVDRAYLDAPPPGAIANLRGFKVVAAVGCDERKSSKSSDDRLLRARPLESLQDLLIDEPRRNHELADRQRSLQGAHLDEVAP